MCADDGLMSDKSGVRSHARRHLRSSQKEVDYERPRRHEIGSDTITMGCPSTTPSWWNLNVETTTFQREPAKVKAGERGGALS